MILCQMMPGKYNKLTDGLKCLLLDAAVSRAYIVDSRLSNNNADVSETAVHEPPFNASYKKKGNLSLF